MTTKIPTDVRATIIFETAKQILLESIGCVDEFDAPEAVAIADELFTLSLAAADKHAEDDSPGPALLLPGRFGNT